MHCLNEDKLKISRPVLQSLNASNVYKTNLYRQLTMVCKLNKNQTSLMFNKLIKKSVRMYSTKFAESCCTLEASSLKATKYSSLNVV